MLHINHQMFKQAEWSVPFGILATDIMKITRQ